MSHRIAALAAALFLTALAVPTLRAEELPTFKVVARDGRFTPARLEVPAGRRIKIVLSNEGPGPLEFENDELHIEKIVAAGAESFVVFRLAPGEYSFVDEFNIATGELSVAAR